MQFEKGAAYHIYNRSINREQLFKTEENYRYFLQKFNHYLSKNLQVFAYCLMPTHFHFFVRAEADSALIEKGFKNLFIAYAKALNVMFDRTGSIFQAKYKKDAVADDAYFTTLIAYIHLNPVKAGLCTAPDEWKFSSYQAITGSGKTNVSRQEVIEWFGSVQSFIDFHKAYE